MDLTLTSDQQEFEATKTVSVFVRGQNIGE